jgi:hypothetical protein
MGPVTCAAVYEDRCKVTRCQQRRQSAILMGDLGRSIVKALPRRALCLVIQMLYRLLYLVKVGFLTKALFSRQLNKFDLGSDTGPKIACGILWQLKLIYLCRSLFGAECFSRKAAKVYRRLGADLYPNPSPRTVDTIPAGEFDTVYLKEILLHPRPVVIRGLAPTPPR